MAGPRIQRFSGWGKLYDVGRGATAVFVVVLIVLRGQIRRVVRFEGRPQDNNETEARGLKTNGTVSGAARRRVPLTAGCVFESALAVADFESVTTIDGLYVEDVFRCEAQHALHRCRHVLVHAVGELDHNDRAFARRSN